MRCSNCGGSISVSETVYANPDLKTVRHAWGCKSGKESDMPARQAENRALVCLIGYCCAGETSVLREVPVHQSFDPSFLCVKCGGVVAVMSIRVEGFNNGPRTP